MSDVKQESLEAAIDRKELDAAKLLPCPFCAKAAQVPWKTRGPHVVQKGGPRDPNTWLARFHVQCGRCGAQAQQYTERCLAIAAWNARAAARAHGDAEKALRFYANHNHWMQLTENSDTCTLLVAGGACVGPNSMNGWAMAEAALSHTPKEGA